MEYGGAFYHVIARGNRREAIFLDDEDRLFGDCYKAVIVEGEVPAYYEALMNDIHLNAGRAGLVNVEKGESILDYPWSSVAGAMPCRLGSERSGSRWKRECGCWDLPIPQREGGNW